MDSNRPTEELLTSPSNARPFAKPRPSSANSSSKSSLKRRYHSQSSASSLHSTNSRLAHFSGTPRGYDWIASRVDRELADASSLLSNGDASRIGEKDEQYYRRVNDFRHANHDSCFAQRKSSSSQPQSTPSGRSNTSGNTAAGTESKRDDVALAPSHPDMVGTYRLDERLLPSPLHHGEPSTCTLCRRCKKKSCRLHPQSYVCVSFPRSTLRSVYQWKKHCSSRSRPSEICDDESHSGGYALSSSCREGWQSSRIACLPPAGTMDLLSDCDGTHASSHSLASAAASRSVVRQSNEQVARSVQRSTPQLLNRTRLQSLRPAQSAPATPLARKLTY